MNPTLPQKQISINSSVENLAYVEKEIEHVFETLDGKDDLFGNVLIAVTEAVNNAIRYGNSEDVTKTVRIGFSQLNNELIVNVHDEGEGFDYDALPDPTDPNNLEKLNGRGIYLMRHLSDNLTFSNKGSSVEMIFKL
jgi:serine/threonine-protein kinase RsbW